MRFIRFEGGFQMRFLYLKKVVTSVSKNIYDLIYSKLLYKD